jgi:hypothetical protein
MSKTGIIYKLVSSKTDLVYIGSTTQTLHARLLGHRKKGQTTRATMLFEYGKNDVKIVELVKFNNITTKELIKIENTFIEQYKKTAVNLKGTKNTIKKIKVEKEPIKIFNFDVIIF